MSPARCASSTRRLTLGRPGSCPARPYDTAIGQYARVARGARVSAQLHQSGLANDIPGGRIDAFPGDRRSHCCQGGGRDQRLSGILKESPCFEDVLPGRITEDFGREATQSSDIAGGFASRRIDRVCLVDWEFRQALITFGLHMLRRPRCAIEGVCMPARAASSHILAGRSAAAEPRWSARMVVSRRNGRISVSGSPGFWWR